MPRSLYVFCLALVACKPSPAGHAAGQIAVKVTEALCSELASDPANDSEWIALGCAVGPEVIKVLLPRPEWHAIKARKAGAADAGPGK